MEGEEVTGQEAAQATGRSSAGEPSSPSTTYTQEQVSKIQSGMDRQIVDLKKTVDKITGSLQSTEAALLTLQQEKDAAELELARDGGSDALTNYQRKVAAREEKKQLAKERAEFEASKAETAEALAELNSAKLKKKAEAIASETGVDAELLIKHGDGSEEKMRQLAKDWGKPIGRRPDTLRTSGSGSNWRDYSPIDKVRAALSKQ